MQSRLTPTLSDLTAEFVLVQAWKKTASFIRYHNWFSDILALDRAAVNLPEFLSEVATDISSGDWKSRPLRIVPAPKSQKWHVKDGAWRPVTATATPSQIRPLAHVDLRDQVAATAVMLCLADRVETRQGDPRIRNPAPRSVVSFGNRLFCDSESTGLVHRWASSKLYRQYSEDYQAFLSRPEKLADSLTDDGHRVVIVHSDLKQFYDRVTPEMLLSKIEGVREPGDDAEFYHFCEQLLKWQWSREDSIEVAIYAKQAELGTFDSVALPQGLVSAGFLANLALLDFDDRALTAMGGEIHDGIVVRDIVRYVDDLRIVVTTRADVALETVRSATEQWLRGCLAERAPGLIISEEKTKATEFRGGERPLFQQSRRMRRIQEAVSGGFDAIGGGEILDSVLGLIRTQERYSQSIAQTPEAPPFQPVADVRDATVDRFAAGRFRKTYRSLRPLLWNPEHHINEQKSDEDALSQFHGTRTRSELDDEARSFALELIQKWIEDPSNVRLLRIGLDIWPDANVLERVLSFLRPFTEKGGLRKAPRRIAWYCLSEILRAGVTETGFVSDAESLPEHLDLAAYRRTLRAEAERLVSERSVRLPWYLKQQALFVLAANNPPLDWALRQGGSHQTKHYRGLINYLRGESKNFSAHEFATNAILTRRSFAGREKAIDLALSGLAPARILRICSLDPEFGAEIILREPGLRDEMPARLRDEVAPQIRPERPSLASFVLQPETRNELRNERGLLSFASQFLRRLPDETSSGAILPHDVMIETTKRTHLSLVSALSIRARPEGQPSAYDPPRWADRAEHWRFQLGYLIRFILTSNVDFTRIVRGPLWRDRERCYRPAVSHWHQRLYSLFSGHVGFGDRWLPISDWVETLLYALLSWPGCDLAPLEEELISSREHAIELIEERIRFLSELGGESVALVPINARPPINLQVQRPLRIGVMQSVLPGDAADFDQSDLVFDRPAFRTRHRRHLSAALAALHRMLALRETHKGHEGRLDLLVLPELSVHPHDLESHLVPFARTHKTIIVAGLTYVEAQSDQPLVNTAVWVIPTRNRSNGHQILLRFQGKGNLAPAEKAWENAGLIRGYRPCQWLIAYHWSTDITSPLWLSAAVCYDATDIRLASDLKKRSDVFIVPALNRDVGTFDTMAMALHYHMYQLVIIANCGRYGGSNAYAPFSEPYLKQMFHVHGQPQATISFIELEDVGQFVDRHTYLPPPPGPPSPTAVFKPRPAG